MYSKIKLTSLFDKVSSEMYTYIQWITKKTVKNIKMNYLIKINDTFSIKLIRLNFESYMNRLLGCVNFVTFCSCEAQFGKSGCFCWGHDTLDCEMPSSECYLPDLPL